MIKHYCDRCKREIKPNMFGFKVITSIKFKNWFEATTKGKFKYSTYELCPYCLSDLRQFLDEMKGLG